MSGQDNNPSFYDDIKGGEHGCVLYVDEEDRRQIQYDFLASGISQGYSCIYATATESKNSVQKSMFSQGLNILDNTNALSIVNGEELYGNATSPDMKKWLDSLDTACNNSLKRKMKGLWFAGDLSSYFLKRGLLDQWYSLETALEGKLGKLITIICAYDVSSVSSKKAGEVIDFYRELGTIESTLIAPHNFAIIPLGKNRKLILRLKW